ncbi:GNAT family N-acetyltransferase [Bauldia sp.]|uniref:GNAT family N-acetyltransferase n=1 Tax=Bauldia sp. TaxID=2575872 RepID=UPI003BAB6B21
MSVDGSETTEAMESIPLDLNGYTGLPAGKTANVATFLEMTEPPASRPPLPEGLSVRHVIDPDLSWYRDLIREIGEAWLWSEIPMMPDDALRAILDNPNVEIHVIENGSDILGVAELDRRQPGDVEIVMFGVVPAAIGDGVAHHLMSATLHAAFRVDTHRVWLHTCTNDHPAALQFYRRAGFVPYKIAVEVMDDPRLSGRYPETAAPHVPLIRPRSASGSKEPARGD